MASSTTTTLGKLFESESQERSGSALFMSTTPSKDPESNSGDGERLPVEDWLPITESRNGNIFTTTFHLICSGIGFQVILVPAAFAALGWVWGTIILAVGFVWKLYTTWLLVHLHEALPGIRISRFVGLSIASFGVKLGKILGIFPVMYLSGGACTILVITGGKSIEQLLQIMSKDNTSPLTSVQCFLVFICIAIIISQFPNLNSLCGVSFIGSLIGIAYCTVIWVLPVTNDPQKPEIKYSTTDESFVHIFNAIGLIALVFRGGNLVLEIQGTLPSDSKNPSSKTMWTSVMISHTIIAICMFPLSFVLYWAHGDKIPSRGGPVGNYLKLFTHEHSRLVVCLIHLTFIFSCLCSYPLNLMPAIDNVEMIYITKTKKPTSIIVRMLLRVFLGMIFFTIAVVFPFLPYLAVLIGAIALLVTFTYPCFMWISIKKPQRNGLMWLFNVLVGWLGASLSVLLFVASAMGLAQKGLHANFFNP